MSTQGSPDWEIRKQTDRRANYLAKCDEIRQIWDQNIAHRRGPLPGATLDPFITPRGWCGHVQGLITQSDALKWDNRESLADLVADLYDLPHGAVLFDRGWRGVGDTAFIWAYQRPGALDYHKRLPHTVFMSESHGVEPVPGQLTTLEVSELQDWARKHHDMLTYLRAGQTVDMEQVVRRYNRMRAAILDALTRASVSEVRDMLLEQGLDYCTLGEDIGELLGLKHPKFP